MGANTDVSVQRQKTDLPIHERIPCQCHVLARLEHTFMKVQYQQGTIMTRLKDEYSVKIDKVCVGRRSGTDVLHIQL